MSTDRLGALSAAGVSIWLDDLSRERLETGSLARDVAERHIVGVTTNPSIFAAAVKVPVSTTRRKVVTRFRSIALEAIILCLLGD